MLILQMRVFGLAPRNRTVRVELRFSHKGSLAVAVQIASETISNDKS